METQHRSGNRTSNWEEVVPEGQTLILETEKITISIGHCSMKEEVLTGAKRKP